MRNLLIVLLATVVSAGCASEDTKKAAQALERAQQAPRLPLAGEHIIWVTTTGRLEGIKIYCDPKKPSRAFVVHVFHSAYAGGSGIQVVDPMPEYCPPKE